MHDIHTIITKLNLDSEVYVLNQDLLNKFMSLEPKTDVIYFAIGCINHTLDKLDDALNWYIKSAESGNIMAIDNIAFLYANANIKNAFECLMKNADLGSPNAMHTLGYIYTHGPKKNMDKKGLEWFEKAAELDFPTSYWNLAGMQSDTGDKKSRLKACENYAHAYILYPDETSKNECKNKINTILPTIDTESFIEIIAHKRENVKLKKEIHNLEKENENLKTELEFRPEGPAMTQLAKDFYNKAQSQH